MTVIKGINVFLNIVSGHRCIRVFEFPLYLDTKAHSVILFKRLYNWDLLLLKGPSCLSVTAFYEVSIGFLFGSSQNL